MSAALEHLLDERARLGPAGFAIGGRAPRAAFAPTRVDEVAEVLRACAADGLVARPWGGGVHQPSSPGERYDVALSLARFARVVDHEPGDLTCTLGAGLTLARAAKILAAHGQELPIEAPMARCVTVGGACAANASGPRRAWLGAPRDRVLGMRFVTGEGVVTRSGGKVVKNVAGYASHRLLCGSRGQLAVILEVSFRLLPAPERRLALLFPLGALPPERDRLRAVRLSRLAPSVLTVLDPGAASEVAPVAGGLPPGWALVLGLEADAPWVTEQERLAMELLGVPVARVEQHQAAALWRTIADLDAPRSGLLVAVGLLPSLVADALAALHVAGAASVWAHVEAGGVRARFPSGQEAQARAAMLRLQELDAVPLELPGSDGFGAGPNLGRREEPALAPLRERIKQAFDPRGTLG